MKKLNFRTVRCVLCGIAIRCKRLGPCKRWCPQCAFQVNYDKSLAYRQKNVLKIRIRARKYRQEHRDTIRQQSRELYLRQKKEKKRYNEKLLADVIANPGKYLKKIEVANDKSGRNR